MDEETRAQLLAIFRDELADRIETIETQRPIVGSETASEAEVRAAIEEIYRAGHSLKGAAQAVGESGIAAICHRLEDALGATRRSGTIDRAALLRAVDEARAALRPTATATDLPAAPDAAPASAPAAPSGAGATVRVDPASIELLARAVQDLSSMLGVADEGMEEREIAAIAAHLSHRLREVRGMAVATPELAVLNETLEDIFETLGALRRSLALRRLERGNLRAAAGRRLEQLEHVVRQLRLTSARTLRLALEQTAREAAKEVGKAIVFQCTGDDVSVDREVLDRVREPLTHLVRNAVDHGIESAARRRELDKPAEGRVRLAIRTDGPEVVFVLSDDGAGFDVDALARAARDVAEESGPAPEADLMRHAFEPGVSTRDHVTATSGRGMGLAIVRDSIASLHGTIDVRSRPDRGSSIELRVPIRLNAIDGLVVDIDGTELTIPATAIDRIVRPRAEDVRVIEGGTWLSPPGGDLVPAVLLPGGPGSSPVPRTRSICVVLGRGRRRAGLWVDAVRDLRSVLVRPLHERALGSPCVRAATIHNDGAVGLVLDVASVLDLARPAPARAEVQAREVAPARILVVDDSITTRQLVRVVLESAGYGVAVAEDGEAAWRKLRDEGPFDLVVSDIDMPHLDGLALLARMRATASFHDIPVVLVTALQQEEDRRRALDMGADAYVTKSSFDQTSLLDRIRDLLA